MASKKKYYSVAAGRKTGIFTDWASAEKQVRGFAGAKYKSFPSEAEAKAWLDNPVYETRSKKSGAASQIKGPSSSPQVAIPEGATVVHTDGGAIGNPGPGGYGVVINQQGERYELSQGYRMTTNNRMEMLAAIVALEKLQDHKSPIVLFSDSSYLVNGFAKGWVAGWKRRGWKKSDGGDVMNVDLWKRLEGLVSGLDVRFFWLKGHAGHEENERCDQLAVAAARGTDHLVDAGYEQSGLE